MKISIVLRYISLLLAGLMAGSSFSFLIGKDGAIDLNKSKGLSIAGSVCIVYLLFFCVTFLDLYISRRRWKSLEYLTIVFAVVCVIDDQIMTLFMDLPLSQNHHPWGAKLPINWMQVHSQWINFMYIRCALLVSSFVLLAASTYLMIKPKSFSQKGAVAVA